jgi:hypothetical protein
MGPHIQADEVAYVAGAIRDHASQPA